MADEKRQRGPRPAVPELALHPVHVERQRRGDGRARGSSRRKSASTGCAGRSPTIPRTRTRAASCPGRRRSRRSATRSGTTTTSATRSPARRRERSIDVRTPIPGLPLIAAAGRPLHGPHARAQSVDARRSPPRRRYGRRLVRLGAQLCGADGGADRPRLRARVAAAAARSGERADVPIEIPAPARAGRYALKFDLVSEGIDWFERCGSQTTTRRSGS